MREPKKNYVAVLPDGTEIFTDVSSPSLYSAERICGEAVRSSELRTPRVNPTMVKVDLFSLEIEKGKLKRRYIGEYEVMPYKERMTEPEYRNEMKNIVSQLPEEFRGYVESRAWDDGHSAGYEEVVSLAESMVDELLPCIDKYTKRITK